VTPAELETFQRDGIVTVTKLFAVEELAWLAEEARALGPRLTGRPKDRVADWSTDEAPDGTLFDVDLYAEPFRRLIAHPRLLAGVRALLAEPLYVHRTRLIADRPAEDVIWRRDFATWHRIAGIPAPRLVTAAVFLNARSSGAPGLFALTGSHRAEGPSRLAEVPADLGSVAFLHGDLAYALRQGTRTANGPVFLISYNALGNQPVSSDWVGVGAFRPRPLDTALSDDCLWPPAFAVAG